MPLRGEVSKAYIISIGDVVAIEWGSLESCCEFEFEFSCDVEEETTFAPDAPRRLWRSKKATRPRRAL